MSRFGRRKIVLNKSELYDQFFEERDVKYFRQYETPNFKYPDRREMREFETITHIWKVSDKYYKLAHEFYGDSTFWWVIAWFNKSPTESHLTPGKVIYIPVPLQKVIKYLRND